MDAAQALALTVAGVVLPVVQEKLAGAKIAGTKAIWLNFAAAVAIAIAATAISGGFGAYNPNDPSAFVGAMLGKAAGIFALSQIIFHSAQPVVAKLGGTPPPADPAPPAVAKIGPTPAL